MSNLIRFPQERRTAAVEDYRAEPAIVLILPSVRIDRLLSVEAEAAIMSTLGLLRDAFLPTE